MLTDFHTSPSRRFRCRGFTLIELLIVVVIIGMLAAVAAPRYIEIRHRSGRSTLTTDLRNLAASQESFFVQQNAYTTDFDSLHFRHTRGVEVTIVEADEKGWSAKATRSGLVRGECSLFYGAAAPIGGAKVSGTVACY